MRPGSWRCEQPVLLSVLSEQDVWPAPPGTGNRRQGTTAPEDTGHLDAGRIPRLGSQSWTNMTKFLK